MSNPVPVTSEIPDPFTKRLNFQCFVCKKYWAVPDTTRARQRTEWTCPHCGSWQGIKYPR